MTYEIIEKSAYISITDIEYTWMNGGLGIYLVHYHFKTDHYKRWDMVEQQKDNGRWKRCTQEEAMLYAVSMGAPIHILDLFNEKVQEHRSRLK